MFNHVNFEDMKESNKSEDSIEERLEKAEKSIDELYHLLRRTGQTSQIDDIQPHLQNVIERKKHEHQLLCKN